MDSQILVALALSLVGGLSTSIGMCCLFNFYPFFFLYNIGFHIYIYIYNLSKWVSIFVRVVVVKGITSFTCVFLIV